MTVTMPTDPAQSIAEPGNLIARLDPVRAKQQIHMGHELAFLDIRERGEFADGHPVLAVSCPYSLMEAQVGALVPRLDVPILLMDGGDGIADRAAAALIDMGYGHVSLVAGGAPAWRRSGLGMFSGMQVPAQVLADLPESDADLETIDADTLSAWQASGRNIHLIDCSAEDAFVKASLPGARGMPLLELAHRLPALMGDGATLVLSSLGRMGARAGARLLALTKADMPVVALADGCCGWALSGRELARGNRVAAFPEIDRAGQAVTRATAASLLASHGIPLVDRSEIEGLRSAPLSTTYLFDIRTMAEADADPLRAFSSVSGSELIVAPERWIGVRKSRVVLADDLGLRAVLAAVWLRRMGHDARVALIDDSLRAMRPLPAPEFRVEAPECSAREALRAVWAGKGRFLDLRSSQDFRAGHVPGATWSLRPRLAALASDPQRPFYIIADGTRRASLAALDLLNFGHSICHVIVGGFEELKSIGAPTEATPGVPSRRDAIDFVWINQGVLDGGTDAMRRYLQWEMSISGQLDCQERAEFNR